MRVLLINPSFLEEVWSLKYLMKVYGRKSFAPPLSLLTVAALLPKDWELRVVDLNVGRLTGRDWDWADAVMFTGMNCQQSSLLALIGEAKQRSKTVVCGGPYPTFSPQEVLDAGCNILVRGEAEDVADRLIQSIKNKTNGEVIEGSSRPDVTASPAPRFDLLRLMDYGSAAIQISRGCPVDCEFCNVVTLYGRRPRYKTNNQVLSELDALYDAGYRGTVFVCDDNFIAERKHALSILNSVARWVEEKGRPFGFFTQAGINLGGDEEMMRSMVRARFEGVLVGIESPDEESLRISGKKPNIGNPVQEWLKNINENGINVVGAFVVGLDGENPDIQDRVCEFVESISLPIAQILPLKIWPETRLWHRLESAGRLIPEKTSAVHEAELNYVPETSEDQVLQRVTGIYARLYEPANYLARAFRCVKAVQSPQSSWGSIRARLRAIKGNMTNATLKDQFYSLRAFMSLVWAIGLRPSLMRQFWGQLINILKERPDRLEQYVELCLGGESMRRYSKVVARRVDAIVRRLP
ncbi:MAG TPA: B12-binding domain-containing radical SAM protein [Desulfomonilaceae bacterium]|nr:B12-binding domain-containing radical SAM protein [Desulfomonilaceae bacterium]